MHVHGIVWSPGYCPTIATLLPPRRRLEWGVLGSFGIAGTAETALITLQAWRGVPSHFDFNTPFDTQVFEAMGVLIVIVAVALVLMTVWCFRSLHTPLPSLRLAILTGLVLLIVGQGLGGAIIAVGIPPSLSGTGASSVFGADGVIFGQAGVLKDPHAIALHTIRVIPALAWLTLFAPWSEAGSRRAVVSTIIGYSAVLTVSAYQAYDGRAPFAFDPLTVLVMGLGVVLVSGTYVFTIAAVMMGRRSRAASLRVNAP